MQTEDPVDLAILADKKRRARVLLIFGSIVVVLVAALAISAVTFSRASAKKRTVAWSRLNKCLLGTPPVTGSDPYLRFRAIARARMFEESKDPPERLWPGRCVAQMLAFTDMLKEVGELKEGDKDLGYYSRALEQHTAGDGYKDLDTYPEVLRQFYDEAKKTPFTFADPSDVQAPPDPVESKSAATLIAGPPLGKRVRLSALQPRVPGALLYVAREDGGNSSLCTFDGKLALACKASEAYTETTVLGTEDGATPLLRDGTGVVYRAYDGLRFGLPNALFYLHEGGWSSSAGMAVVLDKRDGAKDSDFVLGRASGSRVETKPVSLEGWSTQAPTPEVVGPFIVWTNPDGTFHSRAITEQDVGADVVVGHRPVVDCLGGDCHFQACLVGGRPAFEAWYEFADHKQFDMGYVHDGAAWVVTNHPCKAELHVRIRADQGVFQVMVAKVNPADEDIDPKLLLVDTRQEGEQMVKDPVVSTVRIVGATADVALLESTTPDGEKHLAAIDATGSIRPVSP